MKKILALTALAVLSLAAHAQPRPANVTGGPKSATYMPEAHKRAIRAQQREDDKKLETERAAQKKATSTDPEMVDGAGPRPNRDR